MALTCLRSGLDVIHDGGARAERIQMTFGGGEETGTVPRMSCLRVSVEVMTARALRRTESPSVDPFTIDEESFVHPPGEEPTLLAWGTDASGQGPQVDTPR